MSYIVPIHKPDSVRYAVKVKLLSADEDCLVVAKVNRLEIFEQTETGLVLKCTSIIYGTVIGLQKFRTLEGNEQLIVVTDRQYFFTVSWHPDQKRLVAGQSFLDEGKGHVNESMNASTCIVDHESKLLVLDFFDGLNTLVPLNVKSGRKRLLLGDPSLERMTESMVRSSGFLHGMDNLVLMLLWEDSHGDVFVSGREIENVTGKADMVPNMLDTKFSKGSIERSARFLIPIPDTRGGMLVVSELSLHYMDWNGGQCILHLDEPTAFSAWDTINGQKHLLADDYGYLYLVHLEATDSSRPEIKFIKLGSIPRAAVLVYLDNNLVYIGSHQGDSQVIRLCKGDEPIEVLQTLHNLSPVLDFSIMDLGNPTGKGPTNEFSSGQSRIVTGSGAFESGSLRSVRSGVALHDVGLLAQSTGTRDMFGLNSSGVPGLSDILLVSTIQDTRIFQFSANGEAEEVDELKGILSGEETLEAANCSDGRYIQVTGSVVRLVDFEGGTVLSEWTPPHSEDRISTASINDDFVVVSIKGAVIYILDISKDLMVKSVRQFTGNHVASSVFMPPAPSKVCVVGFWTGSTVALLDIDTLEPVCKEVMNDVEEVVPRTLMVAQLIQGELPTLLVGMADGLVYTFSIDMESYKLSNRRATVLGTEQPNFKALPRDDQTHSVYATCEHPSLIYGADNRIVFSSVTADKAVAVCSFNTEAFPGSIVIATDDEIRITAVDTERTTHVRTLPLRTTVRRIAYSSAEKVFGLGSIDRSLNDLTETIHSRVKLVDEIMFQDLDTFDLKKNELVECIIRAELADPIMTGQSAQEEPLTSEHFLVGTSYTNTASPDCTRGRVIIFEITQDRLLKRVAEVGLKGACRCLGMYDEYIVAALSRTVVIYKWQNNSGSAPTLEKLSTYRTAHTPISLSINGPSIIVADIMKSITVLTFSPQPDATDPTPALREIARHFAIIWSTAVEALSPDLYLLADAASNLMLLQLSPANKLSPDHRTLEVISEMHLGEQINRIAAVHVDAAAPDATVVPVAFAATAQGGVYVIGRIAASRQNTLMKLQTRLVGPGGALERAHETDGGVNPAGMGFLAWRGFANTSRVETEPFRFVDGEVVERFLELGPKVQEEVARDVGMGAEELRVLVEDLRRIH